MAELNIQQKKEWAKLLFTSERYTQKAVAEKTGVSEQTMSRWVKKEGWEELRETMLTTKRDIIRRLHKQLESVVQKAEENEYLDNKQADIIAKVTAALNNLETETGLKEIIDVGMKFIAWLQTHDFAKSKDVIELYDQFVKDHLK